MVIRRSITTLCIMLPMHEVKKLRAETLVGEFQPAALFIAEWERGKIDYFAPSFSVKSVGRIDTVMRLCCFSSTLLTKF